MMLDRKFLRAAAVISLILLLVSGIRDYLTAEIRFDAKLTAALGELRHAGAADVQLSSYERERYHSLLRCADPMSRWQAAADLARWQDKDSVHSLVAAMQDDAGTQRTCLMAQSLGAIGDSNAVPALLKAIHHPRNLDLRVCATHALAEIGDVRAIEPLIEKAENPKLGEDDRVSAIMALGDFARPEAAPALRHIATNDPDGRFRTIATAALRKIELMQTNDPVPALATELNSPDLRIQRTWLIQKLGEKWDSRAVVALNKFLRRPDGWTSDRVKATALLLDRHSMKKNLLHDFSASSVKEDRWIFRFAQAFESKQDTDDVAANPIAPASARGW